MDRFTDEQRAQAAAFAPLALRCAKRYVLRHRLTRRNCDQVFSAAGMAVIGAVAGYRPERGASLATWVYAKVPLLMLDYLRAELGREGTNRWRETHSLSLSALRGSCDADDEGEELVGEQADYVPLVEWCPIDALELSEMWERVERILPAKLLELVRLVYRDGLKDQPDRTAEAERARARELEPTSAV